MEQQVKERQAMEQQASKHLARVSVSRSVNDRSTGHALAGKRQHCLVELEYQPLPGWETVPWACSTGVLAAPWLGNGSIALFDWSTGRSLAEKQCHCLV